MEIAKLLSTFSSSLGYYIDEFNRLFVHVSENLPVVGNQIELQVKELESINSGDFDTFIDHLKGVKTPIFEIIIELQKQDIINQQLNHLKNAVFDVREIIIEDKNSFDQYETHIKDPELRENYRHLFTLVDFLLNNLEKQMNHINKDMLELISRMDDRFSDLSYRMNNLDRDIENPGTLLNEGSSPLSSILKNSANYSHELKQYTNFFKRLGLLHEDLNGELVLCIRLKEEVEEKLSDLGGPLPLGECRFTNTVIQGIVDKLSVEDERQTLRKEYKELDIEESYTQNIVLF